MLSYFLSIILLKTTPDAQPKITACLRMQENVSISQEIKYKYDPEVKMIKQGIYNNCDWTIKSFKRKGRKLL